MKKRGESGQSTVEFALTLLLIVIFFLTFTQISLLFGFGNYVHYATFMSARAKLSAGGAPDDQATRAQAVLTSMIKTSNGPGGKDRWGSIGQGIGGSSGDVKGADLGDGAQYAVGDPALSWMQGVRYTFKGKVFLVPFGGDASSSTVTLTSESWLGQEDSYQKCSEALTANGAAFDNGC